MPKDRSEILIEGVEWIASCRVVHSSNCDGNESTAHLVTAQPEQRVSVMSPTTPKAGTE